MALARERDGCKTFLEQTNRITACKYLWRQSELKKYCTEGCGVFNDDVMERCYDMERYMWTSVRLETSSELSDETPRSSPNSTAGAALDVDQSILVRNDIVDDLDQTKLVTMDFTRDDLDEVAIVPIADPERLFKMPELRFAFLRNLARVESGSVIFYSSVLTFKRLLMLVILVLQVLFASKTYEDERKLGLSIIVSASLLHLLYSLRDRVTEEDLGGPDSRVSRMLAVDTMSVGLNLIRYSNRDTSWTRHSGFGSVHVGAIDIMENILHNRTIVMGEKIVSLSREGTSMFIGEVRGTGKARTVSGWRKADQQEVLEATGKPLPDLDMKTGG